MDARPCRPRAAESAMAMDQLHQRHKSAGSLANGLAAPVAGFRGAAKRSAFGDVTNLSKGLLNSARDDQKPSKMPPPPPSTSISSSIMTAMPAAMPAATSIAKSSHLSAHQNKENAPFPKDSFARPAQRPPPPVPSLNNNNNNNNIKSKAAAASGDSRQDSAAARRPQTASAVHDLANLCRFNFDIPRPQEPLQQHAASGAAAKKIAHTLPSAADALPRQPRHYKSQPHLKQQQPPQQSQQQQQQQQQQPPLRRAQTKLERTTPAPSSEKPDPIRPGGSGKPVMTAAHCNGQASDHAYLDPLCVVDELPKRLDGNGPESYADLPLKLPNISEEPASDISFKDYPTLALSEPEEAWDYDDDDDDDDGGGGGGEDIDDGDGDYDDQDQAYTTTYSTKSRDLTLANVTTMLAPRVTARAALELENARLEVERTRPAEDIEEEAWDVSMVAEYGDDIFAYMRELEVQMSPNPDYMDMQTEIQWSMRSVLMDWVVQVHNRFNLLPETLFLTVNYIDRFLSCKVVSIGKLQLVGATAILVASKYEEINCPSLEEIVYMVDGGYTTEEVLKAERFMLSMLSFELGWPGPMSFLRRVSKADDYDLETRTLAKYFMELTIMDERFVASPPSFVAAGAHCLSRLILHKGHWTKHHVHYSGYTWGQLKPLVTMMVECCENPEQHHSAIFDKYKEKRFREASLLVQQALDGGFTLPHHAMPVRRTAAAPGHRGGVPDHPRAGVFLPV